MPPPGSWYASSRISMIFDPDHHFCDWWARGVWIGSEEKKLPRTPALYERKTKWPLHDDSCALHGDWKANYSSLREHEAQVPKQFAEEIEERMMISMHDS